MGKTLALLAGFGVLAGGLGLYAFYGIAEKDKAESARKEAEDHLFAPPAGDKGEDGGALAPVVFTRISVTAKGETTVLEKTAGAEWVITSPVNAPADKLTVDGLVSQLQTAKFKDQIDEAPDDAALLKYGLKQPQFTVSAEAYVPNAQGGGADDPARRRDVTLLGGIENTFDGSVYLQRKGQKPVYSAEGGVRWSLEKSTYELRSKELVSFDEPKVKALEVKGRLGHYAVARDEKKAWQLTVPLSTAADGASLVWMLGALKSERVLSFPADTPEARVAFGLEAPIWDATFTLESGETVRLRVSEGAGKTYALREGPGASAALAEVSPAAAALLDKSPAELKDKSVLSFKREEVARISFRLADGRELSVHKRPPPDGGGSNDDWDVVAPQPGPAKKWKLSSILWSLGALRAGAFGEENPKDWAKYGITAKSRQVGLADAEGRELARLTLGSDVEGKPGFIWVRGTRPQVLEADSSRLTELPQSLADVLDAPPPQNDAGVVAPPSP
ncbi:MAG: DUF4340 domain-containing protein [Myxococcaceae bacterium]